MQKLKHHYKTVWISDLHFGSDACKAEILSDFLSSFSCDTLYLVGDIIDFWAMKQSMLRLTAVQVECIRKIIKKPERGTVIKYAIGNHDALIREYIDSNMMVDNIILDNEFIHTTLTGKKYLVVHGDKFDTVTRHYKWVAHLGDFVYGLLINLNTVVNRIRAKTGMDYWSLSNAVKSNIKQAVAYIHSYEHALTLEAKHRGLDGVICGHIHTPVHKVIDGIEYWNDGDFTESCTALVELEDGTLEIVKATQVIKAWRSHNNQLQDTVQDSPE